MIGVSMSTTECNPVNFLVSKSLQWKPNHLFWLKPKLFGVFFRLFLISVCQIIVFVSIMRKLGKQLYKHKNCIL